MGSSNSQRTRQRGNSAESSRSADPLEMNMVRLQRSNATTSMIYKLNNNEHGYENAKSIFRRNFRLGTISEDSPRMFLDKGDFLKKFKTFAQSSTGQKMKIGEAKNNWLVYLYKKISWWNQHYDSKYKWCGIINHWISKKMNVLLEEREKIFREFSVYQELHRTSESELRGIWKGIDTTNSNLEKFKKINKDLEEKKGHPLNAIISVFHHWIIKANNFLLHPAESKSVINFERVKETLIDDMHRFIVLLFFTTIKFYNLNIKDNDNNTDILVEILTGRVLRDKLYAVLHNALSYCLKDDIRLLHQKMLHEERFDFDSSRYIAGISEIFSFSKDVRKQRIMLNANQNHSMADESYDDVDNREDKRSNRQLKKCMKLLHKLRNIQNPTDKAEMLVRAVNQIKKEIDDFWVGVDIHRDEKCIDADSMEKLLAYVVLKSKYPKIVVDLHIIESFSGNYIDFLENGYIFASYSNTISCILHGDLEEIEEKDDQNTPSFNDKENSDPNRHSDFLASSNNANCKPKIPVKRRSYLVTKVGESQYSLLVPAEIMEYSKSLCIQACS